MVLGSGLSAIYLFKELERVNFDRRLLRLEQIKKLNNSVVFSIYKEEDPWRVKRFSQPLQLLTTENFENERFVFKQDA